MNNGIKNKLKTLIGEDVDLIIGTYDSGIIHIEYPSSNNNLINKVLRIEDEDCVVLGNDRGERFLSIDHISFLYIRKT